MKIIARQGDITVSEVDTLPKGLKVDVTNILVLGESTGHSHKLAKGKVYKAKNGDIYLDVKEKTQIIHEEHKPITLKKGKYFVGRQREYLSKDMTKIVVD